MALESGSYISDLVPTNPLLNDDISQADDHLRLIKQTLKNTFPNLNGAMTTKEEILNVLSVDITPPAADGYLLSYDLASANIKWVSPAAGGGGSVPVHTHSAADITSGTMNILRLPTGVAAGTVSLGDHTHDKIENDLWVTGNITAGPAQQTALGWASANATSFIGNTVVNGDVALTTWSGSASYYPVRAEGSNHSAYLSYGGTDRLWTTNTGVSVNGRISALTTPSAASDAATKNYVDTKQIQTLHYAGNVRADAQPFGLMIGGGVYPTSDGGGNCGTDTLRWATVYAVNGTIQTSDAREKQEIEPLSPIELEAARRLVTLVRRFHWRYFEDTRHHVGVIAQDVVACMLQLGLNALDYGFITLDREGENERYGINYSELAMFMALGQDQILARHEHRIKHLEKLMKVGD